MPRLVALAVTLGLVAACSIEQPKFEAEFVDRFCEHQASCEFPVYADVAECTAAAPVIDHASSASCAYEPTRAKRCFRHLSDNCIDEGWARFSNVCYSVFDCYPEQTFRELHATITCHHQRNCDDGFEAAFGDLQACIAGQLAAFPSRPACYSETRAHRCLDYLTAYHGSDECGFIEYPEPYHEHCDDVWACD